MSRHIDKLTINNYLNNLFFFHKYELYKKSEYNNNRLPKNNKNNKRKDKL